jgi:hypothetical protein
MEETENASIHRTSSPSALFPNCLEVSLETWKNLVLCKMPQQSLGHAPSSSRTKYEEMEW